MTTDDLNDDRETRLPVWARTLLSHLRSQLRYAEADRDAAVAAAVAAAGKTDPDRASAVVELPDGTRFGLPEDASVEFRTSTGSLTASTHLPPGVLIDAVFGEISVHPVTAYQIRVVVTQHPRPDSGGV